MKYQLNEDWLEAHYDYEVEYYDSEESEARQGSTCVDVYTSPSANEVLKQWLVDHPNCSEDCVVRIEEVEEEEIGMKKVYQLDKDWLDFKIAFARELAALGATGEETEAALDIAFANVAECDNVARCAWDILTYNVRPADENRAAQSIFAGANEA